jgi:predicted DNA-binding protein
MVSIYMGMKKVTFTLDDNAMQTLERAAERLDIPKSQIVREALELYGEQLGRLTDEERVRMLATFDRMLPTLPERGRRDVDQELSAARSARLGGGRASDADA